MIKKLFFFFKNRKQNSSFDYDVKKKKDLLRKIEELVGVKPKEENYFLKAFTHRSFLEKSSYPLKSNERLEFLGDSVLGEIVAEYLFEKYPDEEEGFLTKTRSHLVNKQSLKKIAFSLNLQDLLFFNDRYLIQDEKKLSNIVADCLEAVIGAIYLDMGHKVAKNFVIKYVITPLVVTGDINNDNNYKGQLLEFAHANKLAQPKYNIIDQSGPQHDKIYTIEVIVNDEIKGIGKGSNKKIAEQNAAKKALSNQNQN